MCSYFQDLSLLKWELLFCCIRVRRHRNGIVVKESHKYSNAIIFTRGFRSGAPWRTCAQTGDTPERTSAPFPCHSPTRLKYCLPASPLPPPTASLSAAARLSPPCHSPGLESKGFCMWLLLTLLFPLLLGACQAAVPGSSGPLGSLLPDACNRNHQRVSSSLCLPARPNSAQPKRTPQRAAHPNATFLFGDTRAENTEGVGKHN